MNRIEEIIERYHTEFILDNLRLLKPFSLVRVEERKERERQRERERSKEECTFFYVVSEVAIMAILLQWSPQTKLKA